MKNLKQIAGVILFGSLLIGCSQDKSLTTKEILADKKQRNEIMMEISGDDEVMNEMMDHMMKNNRSMHMMSGNRGMMKHMMYNMMSDSSSCSELYEMMMENGHMMRDSICMKELCWKDKNMKN